MRSNSDGRVFAKLSIIGPDKAGVVAAVTNFLFSHAGNVEEISQHVVNGLFGMHLEASWKKEALDPAKVKAGLVKVGQELAMDVRITFESEHSRKRMALLVTKEPLCPETILAEWKAGRLKAEIPVIIGSEKALEPLAKKYGIPFHLVDDEKQEAREEKTLKLLEKYEIDFLVLARYMKILSPNFVWRYPNRIINIHPSLLPAFPGARAYLQAYERGVRIVGCSAHFVTMDLDQGPIICQDCFKAEFGEPLEEIKRKGQELEAKTLLEAVKLFLDNKLDVYWNKVHLKK
ncbi:Formyltetrahydrofolate deformylase [Candidatus Gugararchaeum adminiculabundum]|nr:Formyltetrahydrofolate deformylase [Candidatus Gugararchaeum adminiculabundum]